ncbi:MAG: MG2 domain-containing protein [Myxococcota bacterium]|nr:MG2 domain-containing protein [Myxococcota bacterium]
MHRWIWFGILLLLSPGCRRERTDLHVTARTPEGQLTDAQVQQIRVVFNKPMVSEGLIGRPLDKGPISLEPSVPGKHLWVDPKTLVFQADAPLPRSTHFRVALATALRALDGARTPAPVRWSFTTQRLQVQELLPQQRHFFGLMGRLTLRFSQPVVPKQVAARCLLESSGGRVPLRLVEEEEAAPRTSVSLVPAHPLQRGTQYQLYCDAALSGAEGRVGMAAPYTATLRTHGELAVLATRPTGRGVNTDDLDIEIEFTNPMEREQVRTHLVSKPSIHGLDEGWLEGPDRRRYHVRVSLEPTQTYEIRITRGLKDAFGQELAADHTFSFTTGDAQPRLSMIQGTCLVEANPGRLPLWTRNISTLEVAAARVPEDKLVPLLEYARSEPPEEEETQQGVPPHWHRLGLKIVQRHIPTEGNKNQWRDGALDLSALTGGERTGVFVARVRASEVMVEGRDRRPRQVVASVTNLGLVAKTGPAGGLVWAVHLSDGKPAPRVRVMVRDYSNRILFTGTTGEDGVVLLPPIAGAARRDGHPHDELTGEMNLEQLYIIAREGADVSVLSGSWRDGLYPWNFSIEPRSPPGRTRGFLQTDRGLYRPGEVVHIRGLLRALRPGQGLGLPRERKVVVTVEDPRGDEVLRRTVPLSPFGGFFLDLPLPAAARLGDWSVTATAGQGDAAETFRDHFSVEEYRPATFEVKLRPHRTIYRMGDAVRVDLEARYFYGAPVGRGRVRFSVRRRDRIPTFPDYAEFSFADLNALEDVGSDWARNGQRSYSYDAEEQEVALAPDGRATLRFSTADPAGEQKTAQDYLVEATVTDESNQSRSAHLAVVAHRSPFYLGLQITDWVPEVDRPFIVRAVAVDEEGRARAAEADLVVSLRQWQCDYKTTTGGYYGNYHCTETIQELERRKVQLSAEGPSDLAVTVRRAGTILLSLRAPDGRGHQVVASNMVWAVGKEGASWRMPEGNSIPLQANRKRYRPGDTALLVAQAPLEGATALITLEREGILSHRVEPFTSASAPIAVPLTAKHVPNVYASVVLVRGRTGEGEEHRPTFRMGVVDLEVDAADRRLRVEVQTDRPSYRPGETVRARLSVRSIDDTPVRAEVALAAADEGVLQLIGYRTPDPQAAFYAPYGLGVDTAANWSRIARRGNPSEDNMVEGGDSGDGIGRVRQKFISTAFWSPALVTSEAGTAEVSFPAPDNLTAFRIMASAADAGDRFGSAEVRFTVAKPLAAAPALPRFFTAGDRVQAGVVIHNRTAEDGAVTVTAAAEGAELLGEQRRVVEVPSNTEKLVLFDLRAAQSERARLTFTATLGHERDAVSVTVPISRPLEWDTLLLGEGEAQPGVQVHIVVTRPEGAAEGSLELVLDPTGLSGIDEGLRYLIEYPYGCLEQTTSRLIPLVSIEELARSLDLPGLRGDRLRGFIEEGVAKVLRHQHDDGAFSLWPGGRPEPFLTAFALYGLHQVQRAGHTVPASALARAVAALRRDLGERSRTGDFLFGEGGARALALYVLAEMGQPDGAAMEKLAAQRATLPLFGQALLARALWRGGGDASLARQLAQEVAAQARPVPGVPGAMRIAEPQQDRLWQYFSSDVRTTAMALSMLLEVDPQSPLVSQLARGLLAARQWGRWNNTQDNLFSLVALADQARARHAVRGAQVKVMLGSRTLLQGRITPRQAVQRVQVPLAQLGTGGMLTLVATGEPLFYSARLRYGRSLEKAAAAQRGFWLQRRLLDPQTGQPIKVVRTGDLVRVELHVRPEGERNFVALTDFLPAGLEPLNPRLAVHPPNSAPGEEDPNQATMWDAIEMHDDRVVVFADQMHEDKVLSYLLRATSIGRFLWPAATVEEMYRPENRARTAAAMLEVRPR